MKETSANLLIVLGLMAAALAPSLAWAQVAPALGMAHRFAVLGGSSVTGAAGAGVVVTVVQTQRIAEDDVFGNEMATPRCGV